VRLCGRAGDYCHDRFGQEEVHAVRVARSSGAKLSNFNYVNVFL